MSVGIEALVYHVRPARGEPDGALVLLAGAVGPEKARDGARLGAERDAGHDGTTAPSLGEVFGADHDRTLAAAGATAGLGERRAMCTMAVLTARIDRRPTHCRASPMPSPQ